MCIDVFCFSPTNCVAQIVSSELENSLFPSLHGRTCAISPSTQILSKGLARVLEQQHDAVHGGSDGCFKNVWFPKLAVSLEHEIRQCGRTA